MDIEPPEYTVLMTHLNRKWSTEMSLGEIELSSWEGARFEARSFTVHRPLAKYLQRVHPYNILDIESVIGTKLCHTPPRGIVP
eukprot:2259360-Amphidinium_carterae.1